jgi:hypothetical protein
VQEKHCSHFSDKVFLFQQSSEAAPLCQKMQMDEARESGSEAKNSQEEANCIPFP